MEATVLQEMVEALDKKLNETYEQYKELHVQLDSWRGKELSSEDNAEVNKVLTALQLKFSELYGVYHFIGSRSQFAIEQVHRWNDFIDALKKEGAILEPNNESAVS